MNLVEMSVCGGIMILAVLLLRLLFLERLPKKMFLFLWGIVLLRLLVPFEIASPVSIYNLIPQEFRVVRQEEQCQQIDEEQPSQSTQSSLVEEADTAEKNSAAERADATIKNSTEEKTDTAEKNSTAEKTDTAVKNNIVENVWKTIYFAGAEVCFAWFAVSYGRSLRQFATAVPVTGLDVEKWLAEHKCARKISIRRTGAVDTPLTYGLRKPVILLPKNLDLTEKATIEYVLEHEYTHIRRFDQLYKFIMVLAVCIHWWNPLVWLMLYFFNRDIELSCDERVIGHGGTEEKKAYAMALLRMEERRPRSETFCSSFSRNPNEERILAVIRMKKQTRKTVAAMVLVVAVFAVTFATSAAVVYAKPQETVPEQESGKGYPYADNLWAYENEDSTSAYYVHVYYQLAVMKMTNQGLECVADEEAMTDAMKEALQKTMETIEKFWDSENFKQLAETDMKELAAQLQELADKYSSGDNMIVVEKTVYSVNTRELERYLEAASQCGNIN